MNIKKSYYYFYYKLYVYYEYTKTPKNSIFKASTTMVILQMMLILSGLNFYMAYKKEFVDLNTHSLTCAAVIVFLLLADYYLFRYKNKWKKHYREFDKWTSKERLKGNIIVCIVVVLILSLFVISLNLSSDKFRSFKSN